MILLVVYLFVAVTTDVCFASQQPVQISPLVMTTCSSEETHAARQVLLDKVTEILSEQAELQSKCPCGRTGQWTRIADLNMSNSSQQCPPNWLINTTPVRGYGRQTATCDSATYASNG